MLGWEELTEPERAVWNSVEAGSLVQLPLGAPATDDPATGKIWSEDRQIRAQLLFELLAGINGPKDVRPRALKLAGARIIGTLDLEATSLVCLVDLRRCWFEQSINLQDAQAPTVRLPGCRVPSLSAQQLQTRGNLQLNSGFAADGEVKLIGAHIGGDLDLDGAVLTNPYGSALNADRITVDGAMFCRHGFHAEGQVSLLGAHIGGDLDLDGAVLTNPHGMALFGDGAMVDGAMFCQHGFHAEGRVSLAGAHIGGQLSFNGGVLTNPDGWALMADRITVVQHMLCGQGFTAHGEVNLAGARIGGQLYLDGATLNNPMGVALRLQELEATALLQRLKAPPKGWIDLAGAHVGTLVEDQASWPDRLVLHGFVYDMLYENPPISASARLDWLTRDEQPYTPQPYEQLAAVYRRAGRDEDARTIAMAKQRRRRATLNLPSKAWNSLLRWTVGYGYRPWQAGLWLAALWLAGTLIFAAAQANGQVSPAKRPEELQHFNPLVYALDVLLPIVNLGQEGGWVPHRFAAVCFWLLAIAGWVLTTAVVAALTGLIKRD